MSFRPMNETPEHLANEESAAKSICQTWKVDIEKLSPTLYKIDWVLYRNNEPKAFAEFKRRSKKIDPLFISVAKYIQLLELNRITGLPCLLIVQWPEGLWYHNIKHPVKLPLDLQMNGNPRGQNGDFEPVINIPLSLFKEVKNDG